MKKWILLFATLSLSPASIAAVKLDCSLWNASQSQEQINLDVDLLLVFTIGGKLKSMPLAGATLSVVDLTRKKPTLVFHGNLSHLNVADDKGLWSEEKTTVYPIDKDSDPLNPKGVEVMSRKLEYSLVMKNRDDQGTKPGVGELNLNIHPSMPGDGTYIGESRVVLNGKSYENLHTNCSAYIALDYFEPLLKK